MQRHILIIFSIILTLGTVLSAEVESTPPAATSLVIPDYLFAAPPIRDRSDTALFQDSATRQEPAVISLSLTENGNNGENGKCQTWTRQIDLDLNAKTMGRVVETAMRHLLDTERAQSF